MQTVLRVIDTYEAQLELEFWEFQQSAEQSSAEQTAVAKEKEAQLEYQDDVKEEVVTAATAVGIKEEACDELTSASSLPVVYTSEASSVTNDYSTFDPLGGFFSTPHHPHPAAITPASIPTQSINQWRLQGGGRQVSDHSLLQSNFGALGEEGVDSRGQLQGQTQTLMSEINNADDGGQPQPEASDDILLQNNFGAIGIGEEGVDSRGQLQGQSQTLMSEINNADDGEQPQPEASDDILLQSNFGAIGIGEEGVGSTGQLQGQSQTLVMSVINNSDDGGQPQPEASDDVLLQSTFGALGEEGQQLQGQTHILMSQSNTDHGVDQTNTDASAKRPIRNRIPRRKRETQPPKSSIPTSDVGADDANTNANLVEINNSMCSAKELSRRGNERVSLQKVLVDYGLSTQEFDGKVAYKLKMLSEHNAVQAIGELNAVPRETIRNLQSYFMGILNKYTKFQRLGGQKQNDRMKMDVSFVFPIPWVGVIVCNIIAD